MLTIHSYVLGPVQTNAYLVSDESSGDAVVVDPAWDGKFLISEAKKFGIKIKGIWLTHAHFDHIGGTAAIVDGLSPAPLIALHQDDLDLYRFQGGAPFFGMEMEPAPLPQIDLFHGQHLNLGENEFEVRHCPGHTLGHVIFYCESQAVAFSGDVIFRDSIGRTDLPGGDYQTLMNSIQEQILSLPNNTRLFTGHGPKTNVGLERVSNPFILS